MTEQLQNRFSLDGFRLISRMRAQAARPVAIALTLLFLFANAAFAYAELYVEHQRERSAQTDLASLGDLHDLASAPVESREFRSGRESAETLYVPKVEVRQPRHLLRPTATTTPLKRLYTSPALPFPQVSCCEAPFSPRPPPLLSRQG